MDKLWKAVERRIAAILGGRRVPVSGRARGDVPDISHDWLSIEVKQRQEIPGWIREALAQATASARGDRLKLPIAVIHETCQRHDSDLVIMTLGQFQAWFIGPDQDKNAIVTANSGIETAS